mgnify:FL=1
MDEETSNNNEEQRDYYKRDDTGFDNWLLTKEACTMRWQIYKDLLYSIGTYLMAIKMPESASVVGCPCLSKETAEKLGLTEYSVYKLDPEFAAYDIERQKNPDRRFYDSWENVYDTNAKLEAQYLKGYRIHQYGDQSSEHYDWEKYDEQVHDWYVETAPLVQFLWI